MKTHPSGAATSAWGHKSMGGTQLSGRRAAPSCHTHSDAPLSGTSCHPLPAEFELRPRSPPPPISAYHRCCLRQIAPSVLAAPLMRQALVLGLGIVPFLSAHLQQQADSRTPLGRLFVDVPQRTETIGKSRVERSPSAPRGCCGSGAPVPQERAQPLVNRVNLLIASSAKNSTTHPFQNPQLLAIEQARNKYM